MPEAFQVWLQNEATLLEWIAVVFSLIYVFLAARQNIWCWLFGALSAAVSVALFIHVKLYAESILYLYYVVISIYGWRQWNAERKIARLPVTEWKMATHFLLILGALLITAGAYLFFTTFTDAKNPLLDSLITVFSFMATYLVTKKVLSNWIYWIAIDALSVYLYWQRDLNIYAILMVFYTGMAVYGYLQWKKEYDFQIKLTKSSRGLG